MAITKILHMNDSGNGNHGRHLKTAIKYITVAEKTQNGRLVSAVNCQPEFAFEQMMSTKKKFGKTEKRQGYHIILSFEEGEVDANQAFAVAQRFVKAYLEKEYEAVFSVHDNTGHMHAHIIFNSVSFRNGKKYHYKKGDWAREIQPITNMLCKEFGLSELKIDTSLNEKGKRKVKEWNDVRDGRFVWSDMIRRDLDSCIIQSNDFEEFLFMMTEKGYEIKNVGGAGKYLAVKPQGMQRWKRCYSLGDSYSEEAIRRRIEEESLSEVDLLNKKVKPRIVYCRIKRYRRAKMSGLQKQYYAKLYRTGLLKKKPYSQAWKYKDDIKKMHRLQQQYLFLVRHDIHSTVELALTLNNLTDKKKQVSAQKSRVYKARQKCSGLFATADEMKNLMECENCYRNGYDFFEEEHNQWNLLEKRLKQEGYTFEEVEALRTFYKDEYTRIRKLESDAGKEIKMAESIQKDYIGDFETRTKRNEKEEKQKKEHEQTRVQEKQH